MVESRELETAAARIYQVFGTPEELMREVASLAESAILGRGPCLESARLARIATAPAAVRWLLLDRRDQFNPAEFVVVAYWDRNYVESSLSVAITRKCGTGVVRQGVTVCVSARVRCGVRTTAFVPNTPIVTWRSRQELRNLHVRPRAQATGVALRTWPMVTTRGIVSRQGVHDIFVLPARREVMRSMFTTAVGRQLRKVVWQMLTTRDYLTCLPITDCAVCSRKTTALKLLQAHPQHCPECARHTTRIDYCLPHSLEYMGWRLVKFAQVWSRVLAVFDEVTQIRNEMYGGGRTS